MARGWESKSVESQQSEVPRTQKRERTAEDVERDRKRESLELSRGRVQRELESAHTDVHRTALSNALQYLNDELAKL